MSIALKNYVITIMTSYPCRLETTFIIYIQLQPRPTCLLRNLLLNITAHPCQPGVNPHKCPVNQRQPVGPSAPPPHLSPVRPMHAQPS